MAKFLESRQKFTIDNIQITNGQCEVGVYVKSSANKWLNIDNVRLVKVD
ncbi:hypothetical protein KJR18_01650 [Streptococcus lutetiensis]|nr:MULTISPECIES: hypothetical protein [Streptococcus]MBT0936426.1 hypothetical protein [Streptococcus lutetiensis]MBT0945649.1 hypothetical protein [Streptococcus lutetiensis]